MNDHLKRYRITLNVLSPVHIGSGEIIGKKEYIYDKRKGLIYYPDIHRMIHVLKEKKLLDAYESFILGGNNDLHKFLNNHHIDFYPWAGAPINVMGETDYKFNQINAFIKDPYGLPYVPGSSIKGAFRNIVLIHEARRRREGGASVEVSRLNPVGNRRDIEREADRIEIELLNILNRNEDNKNSATNDVMAAFRFSDSEPVDRGTIIICSKIDGLPNSLNRGQNKISAYKECIKPGTIVKLMLTVDIGMLKSNKYSDMFAQRKFKVQNSDGGELLIFLELLNNFNSTYTKEYRANFSGITSFLPNTIYLGGGTGFLTKTMLLGLYDSKARLDFTSRLLSERFKNHRHKDDKELGVSPHMIKLTEYNGEIYEMGMCALEIMEV